MGQTRTDSYEQRAAKISRAKRTQCPNCGRKSALRKQRWEGQTIYYCYWKYEGKCDYERSVFDWDSQASDEGKAR